jgi:nitrile hydratase
VDGPHDVGGALGFGPVVREADEPVFHQRWEGRVFAMAGASMLAGLFGTPRFRHAIERMDVVDYLASSYFEHWLTALATLLVEDGVVDASELVERAGDPFPLSRRVHEVPVLFDGPARARFAVGDLVQVVDWHPCGHTRCPDYVRGHTGAVVDIEAAANVPELEAHEGRLVTEPTYAVRFACRALWGPDAAASESITVDLYDRYLEPAT